MDFPLSHTWTFSVTSLYTRYDKIIAEMQNFELERQFAAGLQRRRNNETVDCGSKVALMSDRCGFTSSEDCPCSVETVGKKKYTNIEAEG